MGDHEVLGAAELVRFIDEVVQHTRGDAALVTLLPRGRLFYGNPRDTRFRAGGRVDVANPVGNGGEREFVLGDLLPTSKL